MSVLPRRSGARCLLSATLALSLVSLPVDAAQSWHRHGSVQTRSAVPKRAASDRARPAHAEIKAADKPASGEPVAAKAASPERKAAWTSVEGERACFRSRRKLWQGSEGWVVKKVSVCP